MLRCGETHTYTLLHTFPSSEKEVEEEEEEETTSIFVIEKCLYIKHVCRSIEEEEAAEDTTAFLQSFPLKIMNIETRSLTHTCTQTHRNTHTRLNRTGKSFVYIQLGKAMQVKDASLMLVVSIS